MRACVTRTAQLAAWPHAAVLQHCAPAAAAALLPLPVLLLLLLVVRRCLLASSELACDWLVERRGRGFLGWLPLLPAAAAERLALLLPALGGDGSWAPLPPLLLLALLLAFAARLSWAVPS